MSARLPRADLDSVTLEIWWNRLITIADEIDRALVRTSFSTVVGEGRDFGVILLDAGGVALAQSILSSPTFTVRLPRTTRALLNAFPPETLQDGDILMTNDPWLGAGHLPDFTVVRPVFNRGKPVAFFASVAHMADVGGTLSYFEARDVFEEGLRIPPSKLYRAGRANEDLFRLIEANVRVPAMVLGDVNAMVAAGYVGMTRLYEFLEDYGLGDLQALSSEIQARSEQAMRGAIAEIPDGVYEGQTQIDGFPDPLEICVRLTIAGSNLRADFTGTSSEVQRSAINATLNATLGDVLVAFKAALVPEIPNNEALFRPLEIFIPEGSVLNCRFPVPVKGRSVVTVHTHQALYDALSKVIPEKIQAGSGSFWVVFANGTWQDGSPFSAYLCVYGGKGALRGLDGTSAIAFPTNSSTTPVEVFENACPLLIERKELLCDSGGPGEFRGGLGQRVILRCPETGSAFVTIRPVKRRYPAPGLQGGQPGSLGRILMDGRSTDQMMAHMRAGQTISIELPGGGGYGPPTARVRELISRDLELGYVSFEAARSIYGYPPEVSGC